MAKALEIIGQDLFRTESKNIEEQLLRNEAKTLGKAAAAFDLETLKTVEHIKLNPKVSESIARNEINDTVTKLALSDVNFSSKMTRIWQELKGAAKVASSVTAIALTSNYVYKYMYQNSGPFYSVQGKKFRIKDPYACGFTLKQGDIVHPLDSDIRKKFKNPCDNYKYYDSCGGWASMSRLQREIDHAKLEGLKGKFTCEHASVADALRSLAAETLNKVSHIFGKSHFLSIILSISTGIVSFTISRSSNLSYSVSMFISLFAIILTYIMLRYLLS